MPHFPVGEALFLPEGRVFFSRAAFPSVSIVRLEVAGMVVEVGAVVAETSFLDLFLEGFTVTGSDTGSEAWTDFGSSSEAVAKSEAVVKAASSGVVVAVIVALVVD